MGKQINFFMDKDTEEKFLIYIKENGVAIFEGNNDSPKIIEVLPEPFSGKGWFKVYLYNNQGDLILNKLSTGREYIDSIKSPVIEFRRTIIKEGAKEVSRGRLWLETKFYNEDGDLVSKDSDLDEWYKNLSKWIKKNAPKTEISNNGREYKEYITKSVVQLLEQGYKIV